MRALAVNIDRISCSITAGKDINRIMQLYITAAIDINSLIPLFLGINTYTAVKDNLTSVIDINTIGFISVHLQITFTIHSDQTGRSINAFIAISLRLYDGITM